MCYHGQKNNIHTGLGQLPSEKGQLVSCIGYAAHPRRPGQRHSRVQLACGSRGPTDVDKDGFSWSGGVRRVNAVLGDRVHCLEGLGAVLQHCMFVPELLC